ncbi:ATP/GTP-binding protein [Vulcanisaeta sp. JCM 14467]
MHWMFTVFIVGTAGSGKTTLVSSFADWLEDNQYDVAIVNLDPAVEYVPYIPDIDIRDVVSARELMRKYKLGPNGSIIAAIDMLAVRAQEIKSQIMDIGANYVLIDTPGQMELFAFRSVGSVLINRLSMDRSAVVFVIDATQAQTPSGYVSSMLLALSTQFRFNMPQVNVLNKVDLLDRSVVDQILEWGEETDLLREALMSSQANKLEADLSVRLSDVLTAIGTIPRPIPISAKTGEGLDALYRVLHNIYVGGSDYDYLE